MSYRIRTVANLTGVSPATLRAWERRYDLVSPRRTEAGYRVYSDADVATISRVKDLVDAGLKVSEAVSVVRRGAAPPVADDPRVPLEPTRAELLKAFLALDRACAVAVLDRLAPVAPLRQVEEVFFPVLREVGDRWERGGASVAQEHFAASLVRARLVRMLEEASAAVPAGAPEGVCAGVPGELHELGLLGAALHLAAGGWRIVYLGADLPVEETEAVVRGRSPGLLCTSLIRDVAADEYRALAARLRAAAPDATEVIVGGAGLPREAFGNGVPGVRALRTLASLPAAG